MEGSEVKDNKKKTVIDKLTSWYVNNRKLIVGLLCAFTVICWLTVKKGLTMGVLFIGKLGRPEYADFYKGYRDEFLITETNLVMTQFRTILFIAAIIFLLCNIVMPSGYERGECPAACGWLFNFALITFGFSVLAYGVLVVSVYKIVSIISVMYILIGVFCFVLLLCTNKDFDTEHPDKFEAKIGSYICGILCVIWIACIGVAKVKSDVVTIKEKKEGYIDKYISVTAFTEPEWDDDEENTIYARLHFYNNYNKDGKYYDYYELKESYLNLKQDNGKTWILLKEFRDDYVDFYFDGDYESDIYDWCGDAMSDYLKLVYQQLYYEGYIYDNGYNQPMLEQDVLDHACQEADKVYTTLGSSKEYNGDVEITVNKPLIVGEDASLDISYTENNGECSAYIMKIGRVSYVGSDATLEEKNCMSQDELIIKDDSVYVLQFMVMSDLNHTLGEDVKVTIEGIDYEDMQVDTWTYSYHDSNIGEKKEAIAINVWVTTYMEYDDGSR